MSSSDQICDDPSCAEGAADYFQSGFYCSEAILKSFHERYDLGLTDDLIRITTAFGKGLGGSRCCCGCLTTGVMIISLVAGRTQLEDSAAPATKAAAELHNTFKKQFGATCCRVLTRKVIWGTRGHYQHCERYVRETTQILESILRERFHQVPRS